MGQTSVDGKAVAGAYAQVILAGSLWATSGPFSIILHRMGVPPTSVAFLRPAVGGLFLTLFLLFLRERRVIPATRPLLAMLLGGGLIVGVFQLAFQMSTEAVGVPATVALLYLAPAFVVALSAPLFRERITLAKGTFALLSVGGVWLTVLGARGVDVEVTPLGILWGCLCGLSYGSYTLFGKAYGRDHGPLLPLFWSTLGGTLFLAGAWALRGEPVVLPPTPFAWSVLLVFGLLTIAAAALLLFNAMGTLEAGRASIGTTVEPLVAALLAMAFLDQVLTVHGWVGMILLVTGVAGAYAMPSPPQGRSARPG